MADEPVAVVRRHAVWHASTLEQRVAVANSSSRSMRVILSDSQTVRTWTIWVGVGQEAQVARRTLMNTHKACIDDRFFQHAWRS
jgi:hypothetical protein